MISRYRDVSHCYQREHEYNLWFTIAAHDEPELEKILEEIRRRAGITEDDVLNLPSIRTFKVDVSFQLT
jgi:DNA-binding Lrp family transcriptional regulator